MTKEAVIFSASDLALFARGEGPLKSLRPQVRLGIFGDPIAHSASPPMQNAALRERGLDMQFVRLLVTPGELPEAVSNLAPAGFIGASITIPHKQAILPLMAELTHEASLMGAVNTIVLRNGKLHGHNTDGPGLSAAILEEFGIPLKQLRVLILGGAGGAGRAITAQCALEGCPSITIANRNRQKGDTAANEIAKIIGHAIASISLESDEIRSALASTDLIINAMPLGMKSGDPSPLPDGMIGSGHLVYDTVYSGGETALLRQASNAGSRCANGLSMLLHQGVLQNELWFGKPAPIDVMRETLNSIRR
jgi:shikimate dehydrogenase